MNGFAIGHGGMHNDVAVQIQRDAEYLYETLEKEVIPLYYERDNGGIPHRWVERMKNTIKNPGLAFQRGPDGERLCRADLSPHGDGGVGGDAIVPVGRSVLIDDLNMPGETGGPEHALDRPSGRVNHLTFSIGHGRCDNELVVEFSETVVNNRMGDHNDAR